MIARPSHPAQPLRHVLLWGALALLASCGGGGDSSAPPGPGATGSAALAQQCAPSNAFAPGTRRGSLDIERRWVRSYVDEAYLWYDEVPNVDTSNPLFNDAYAPYSLYEYFEALKVRSKDRFSFIYPTVQWQQLSGSGIQAGYGIEWVGDSYAPPRDIRIAYVQPGSQAASIGLKRGDKLLTVDGISANSTADTPDNDSRERAMYPNSLNVPHNFVFARAGSANVSAAMTSQSVTSTPVPLAKVVTANDGSKLGYLLFHDNIAPAEARLIDAINLLKAGNVTELVLDIRYNGGGYIYIASELAYMIAGSARTNGKTFESYAYNAKRTADTNSGRMGFIDTSCILNASYNCTQQAPLPTLDLPLSPPLNQPKVYVITGPGTCSASEAIINGLRGVNVDVRQIGGTTCGKPYGFTAKDNCGISYFPIEFKGVNEQGFGDYGNGFTPAGSGPAGVPGCVVADDFSKELGDTSEGMLAATLSYRTSGSCPAQAMGLGLEQAQQLRAASTTRHRLDPARSNRILLPQR